MSDGLTEEMVALLKEGARTRYGKLCGTRSEERKHWPAIKRLIDLGFAYDTPFGAEIRDEGRAAIGAPSYDEIVRRELSSPLVAGRAC